MFGDWWVSGVLRPSEVAVENLQLEPEGTYETLEHWLLSDRICYLVMMFACICLAILYTPLLAGVEQVLMITRFIVSTTSELSLFVTCSTDFFTTASGGEEFVLR